METKVKEISINGIEYIQKDHTLQKAKQIDGMDYVIVRTYSAGVFAGYLESRNGQEAVIRKSRGLWYWDGACALSQLAVDGTKAPDNCKFTIEVEKRELLQVIEIINCTEKAQISIQGIKEWKK